MTYRLLIEVAPTDYKVHSRGIPETKLADAITALMVVHKGHYRIEEETSEPIVEPVGAPVKKKATKGSA